MTAVVFLHIPKTAGQTIHNALVSAVGGPEHVSPIRTHSQAPKGPQMPAGYALYSGHIDWTELDTLPQDKFVFSVLRDPRERIASFYLYLLKEGQALSEEELAQPHNTGKRHIVERSADDYFFAGDRQWQMFIADHYDNFYCSYFATRRMRGRRQVEKLPQARLVARAQAGLAHLDALYSTDNLAPLEEDIAARLGVQISVAQTYHNTGTFDRSEARWPRLLALFEKDSTRARIEEFVQADEALMQKIGMA